ncbi:MAG: twitch domain-containing radical SAM protein [Pseudomonadota bacterium]
MSDSEDTLPDGFCLLPWINSYVSTDGKIAPCCEFDGDIGDLENVTLNQAWTGDKLADIRAAFIAGRPLQACWKCLDREKREGTSMRLWSQGWYSNWHEKLSAGSTRLAAIAPEFPVVLDLRFSNLCNFSCRSCWHGSSSSWFRDAKALGMTAGDTAEIRSFRKIDQVVEQIGNGIDQLEELYFAGGEPLIMEEHYALLELLVARGRTDVSLRYNTNLSKTSFAGKSIFDLWSRFDKLTVSASVDAAFDEGALVRNGFNWDEFVGNVSKLRRACPKADITFGVTVSALNILSLPELLTALVEECEASLSAVLVHSLQEPDHYRSQVLPARLKQRATRKIEDYICNVLPAHEADPVKARKVSGHLIGLVRYMNSKDLTQKLPQFRDIMSRLDDLRGQDSRTLLPALEAIWTDDQAGP